MEDGTLPTRARGRLVVLFADVAGYSRLMADDETATFDALQRATGDARARIALAGGRMVEAWADSFPAVFPNAEQAIAFARGFQVPDGGRGAGYRVGNRALAFRMGIDEGEVEIEGDRLSGGPVHAAARLQERAPAGSVCISDRVSQALGASPHLDVFPLGELGGCPRASRLAGSGWNSDPVGGRSVAHDARPWTGARPICRRSPC